MCRRSLLGDGLRTWGKKPAVHKALGSFQAASLPLGVPADGHGGRRGSLQSLGSVLLKTDLLLEVTQTSKCL